METVKYYQPSIFNPDISDASIFDWIKEGESSVSTRVIQFRELVN